MSLRLEISNNVRLVFDDDSLYRAMFSWARVINTYLLTLSQRRRYNFAGAVNNSRGRAQREANGTLITFNHNRLAGLIGCYRSGCVGRGCSRVCRRCWFRRCCFFGRRRAGLCKS